ncbi:MAG: class I SAM-dependent methyltransferase [Bryobacteraceae bacterium]
MASRSYLLSEALQNYLASMIVREPDVLKRLRAETASQPMAIMQIPPEQGQFLALLVRLMGAKRTLEVGVFTGYSSLAVALALPDDGKIVACDVSEEFTAVARRYWEEAGVARKIDLRLGTAAETLGRLIDEGQAGSFDFAFIDADKPSYWSYFEHCLKLLRQGGLIAVDNVLQEGKVADPGSREPHVLAIREFNDRLRGDTRVDFCMLPLADGLTLALKL